MSQFYLDRIKNFKADKWYTKAMPRLAQYVWYALTQGSAVVSGGVASAGATPVSTSTLHTAVTDLSTKLAGELKATLTGITDVDIMAVANKPIYQDGSDASALVLGGAESAYVTLIAVNGDGAGGVTGDNGVVKLVAVVAGDSLTYNDQASYLTDAAIRIALAASTGVWDATTGWVRLADVLWEGTPASTYTVNRDA